MWNKKNKSKGIDEKKIVPKNQCLLTFLKPVVSQNENSFSINQPKKNIVKYIRIPNSSGDTSTQYPQNPQFLYPQNPEFRQYQFQIAIQCVKYNTLVCLPTGLGKTHVASILITNFTLWFPDKKIFFLAPTRPLVRQQRQSLKWFYQKIGIQNVFQMNGQINASKRTKIYQTKKVIFATPQTFTNDLKEKRINPADIKLIIFDEAHRAVGNSAYAQSIRFLNQLPLCYRIIGLSATPGNQKDKIQQVIINLNISKMMYKDEDEPDVKKYFFNKQILPIIIEAPVIIQQVQKMLDNMVKPYLNFLVRIKIADPWILNSKINSGTFFAVFQLFNQRKNLLDSSNSQFAYSSLRILKFLTDSKQDLISHGYQTFKSKFFRYIESMVLDQSEQQTKSKELQSKNSKTSKNSKSVKLPDQNLPKKFKQKMIESADYKRIKQLFNPSSNILNHPKLQKLKQILDQFFVDSFRRQSGIIKGQQTMRMSKVIVFTHYRSTAHEIKSYLSQSQIIKSELFHGQSKTHIYEDRYNDMGEYENSKQSTLVLNQKQQISIIQKFKQGAINTLIATSIGQQGLDIGEVDCIVCYDGGNKSPIRSIQRFGRTGRKREGVVYILLMKGSEENDYKKGQQKIQTMKGLLKKGDFLYYGFNPSVLKQQSQIKVVVYQNKVTEPIKTAKKQRKLKSKKLDDKEKRSDGELSQNSENNIEQIQFTQDNNYSENYMPYNQNNSIEFDSNNYQEAYSINDDIFCLNQSNQISDTNQLYQIKQVFQSQINQNGFIQNKSCKKVQEKIKKPAKEKKNVSQKKSPKKKSVSKQKVSKLKVSKQKVSKQKVSKQRVSKQRVSKSKGKNSLKKYKQNQQQKEQKGQLINLTQNIATKKKQSQKEKRKQEQDINQKQQKLKIKKNNKKNKKKQNKIQISEDSDLYEKWKQIDTYMDELNYMLNVQIQDKQSNHSDNSSEQIKQNHKQFDEICYNKVDKYHKQQSQQSKQGQYNNKNEIVVKNNFEFDDFNKKQNIEIPNYEIQKQIVTIDQRQRDRDQQLRSVNKITQQYVNSTHKRYLNFCQNLDGLFSDEECNQQKKEKNIFTYQNNSHQYYQQQVERKYNNQRGEVQLFKKQRFESDKKTIYHDSISLEQRKLIKELFEDSFSSNTSDIQKINPISYKLNRDDTSKAGKEKSDKINHHQNQYTLQIQNTPLKQSQKRYQLSNKRRFLSQLFDSQNQSQQTVQYSQLYKPKSIKDKSSKPITNQILKKNYNKKVQNVYSNKKQQKNQNSIQNGSSLYSKINFKQLFSEQSSSDSSQMLDSIISYWKNNNNLK